MRIERLLIAVCAVLAVPTLVRPDLPPPPALQQADARCESLNTALRRLAREQHVPVRLVYANIGFVEIVIPKAHASAADRAGITALGNDEPLTLAAQSDSLGPVRSMAAGIAVAVGVILTGIFLARRKVLIAMAVALVSFVVITTAAIVWVLQERVPMHDVSAGEKKVSIVVRSTEEGPVRVTIPLTLKPADFSVDIIDNYGHRPPPPRPDMDKK